MLFCYASQESSSPGLGFRVEGAGLGAGNASQESSSPGLGFRVEGAGLGAGNASQESSSLVLGKIYNKRNWTGS